MKNIIQYFAAEQNTETLKMFVYEKIKNNNKPMKREISLKTV